MRWHGGNLRFFGVTIMIVKIEPYCVAYEIDFIGIPESEASNDASAICFRWKMSDGTYKIGVYDAGFKAHGEAMVRHMNKYYFNDECGDKPREEKIIDYVFVSHAHNDHASGIPEIIENFHIGCIYMNMPWKYTSELMEMSYVDGRATMMTVEKELREDFRFINEIEESATKYKIQIKEAFSGLKIENGLFKVLSPHKDYYLEMLVNSKKTKRIQALKEATLLDELSKYLNEEDGQSGEFEDWDTETLGDDHYNIDEENETSIVLYGFQRLGGVLLTGDAGVDALKHANVVAQVDNISLKDDLKFVEIPHHGGRHNVTTSLLNELFGEPIGKNDDPYRTAYVSVAENSDHPRNVVVNAFIRRGFEVYKTVGAIRCYKEGKMPDRYGYTLSNDAISFHHYVEKW